MRTPPTAASLRAAAPSPASAATSTQVDATCSTTEAARQLGLAVRSVQMMVDRGELQAWKTSGGHRRISRDSVDRWLSTRRGPASASVAPQALAPSPGGGSSAARPGRRQPLRSVVPAAVADSAGTSAAAGDPAGLRVLLIEDSVHFQNLISLLVHRALPTAQLEVADDGIAGLAMVGRTEPHLLLVDILLPGIDGGALITSLRSHPQFSHIRLIVITSLDEAQRAPYAFALEGVPVVHKSQLVIALPAMLAEAAAQLAAAPQAVDA